MKNPIWTSFQRKIYINAPVERVYACWATQNELETWFLRTAVFTSSEGVKRQPEAFIQSGDHYLWEWHQWEGQEKGKITFANGKDHIVFGFGDSNVHLHLTRERDQTLVRLVQSEIPVDEEGKMQIYVGCSNGWTFWMANLKAYLEHGVLLHEPGMELLGNDGFEFVNI